MEGTQTRNREEQGVDTSPAQARDGVLEPHIPYTSF